MHRRSLFSTALKLAIAAGVALRIIEYLRGRSLWIDESMLAVNVALHSARDLVPLPHFEQVAAPLFVWLLRASVVAFGVNEYALRLVPLLAGCAVVPGVWAAARRTVGPRAALVATWLAAMTPALVRYSAEVKPYSVDALLAVVTVALTARVIRAPRAVGGWWALGIVGMACVGLSVTAPFVLTSAGAAILGAGRLPASLRIQRVLTLGGAWTLAFLPLYVFVYHAEPASSYMRHFWAWAFLGAQPSFGVGAQAVWHGLLSPFLIRDEPVEGVVLVSMMIVGLVACAKRSWWAVALLAGPLALTFAASLARVYPFGGRVGLVAVPGATILVGAGVAAFVRLTAPARRTVATFAIAALVLFEPAPESAWLALRVKSPEEPRQVVQDLLQHARPNEPVYVFVRGVPDWLMYTTAWSTPDTSSALRLIGAVSRLGPNSGNAPPRGRPVEREGDELIFPFKRTVELLGTPTGVEDVELVPPAQLVPDSGWAGNEVRRIMAAARPTAWVVLLHHRPEVTRHLMAALCATGARVSYASVRKTAAAYRLEFDGGRDTASCREATMSAAVADHPPRSG